MTKHELLKTIYGYDDFRPGQETLIDALLGGRDVLAVMPTGAGKSVCFQVPGLLLPGITLVISPLVSLMKDQVMQLVQMGVPAAFLNSSLTQRQYALALERAKQGRYKLIYVAPERLTTPGFLSFALEADISLLAVDEAHCISQWGQDFRPAYLNLPAFLEQLPHRPPVGAFTATATPQVRADILRLLELQKPLEQVSGFDRDNLYFEVQQPGDKQSALQTIVRQHSSECGVVYCGTRKAVEEVCGFLQSTGIAATRYHAGLEPDERRQNQEDFLYDRAQVMVATNAFGMGIDKSNVRYVVHYNMPMDMESYYQEAGRAGRDGAPAACILLYSGRDVQMGKFLITRREVPADMDAAQADLLQQRDLDRLRQMTFYSTSRHCLRQYILEYFGEKAPSYCGNCSNCLQNFHEEDIADTALRILHCVEETGQRFGLRVVATILQGGMSEQIDRYGLDNTACYGVLQSMPAGTLRDSIRFLIEEDYLAQSSGQYPILTLGEKADAFLEDPGPLMMRVSAPAERPAKASPKVRAGKRAVVPVLSDARQEALFQRLRTLRAEIAKRQALPAFAIFTDKTLLEMAALSPRDRLQLLNVSGVGQQKADRYGEAFLHIIASFLDEQT